MPVYAFRCPECGHPTELYLAMSDNKRNHRCRCGATLERDYASETKSVIGDSEDWSYENNGKGRRNPQLDFTDPTVQTHFKSRKQMINYLKGQHTDKVGAEGRELLVEH